MRRRKENEGSAKAFAMLDWSSCLLESCKNDRQQSGRSDQSNAKMSMFYCRGEERDETSRTLVMLTNWNHWSGISSSFFRGSIVYSGCCMCLCAQQSAISGPQSESSVIRSLWKEG